MSGTDIFLSYARQDRATARLFAERLLEHGFSVWWDASLHSGETFDEVIERNLRDARAVVVLWSRASVASRWVRAEATLADRRNKLAPAIIEACDRPIIFELTHAAELSGWSGDTSDPRWQTFLLDLGRLVGASAEQGHVATREAPAARPLPEAARRADEEPAGIHSTVKPGQPQTRIFTERGSQGEEAPSQNEVHCLEVDNGGAGGRLISVDRSGIRIGRTPPADVVLSDRSISRQHCIVGLANDELLVTDLNSTNGTFVDGERIVRATVLPVGSVLAVGQVSMRHVLCSRDEATRRNLVGEDGGEKDPKEGRLAAVS